MTKPKMADRSLSKKIKRLIEPLATLAEVFYCTIDDPLPATVAVTFAEGAPRGNALIYTDTDEHCEGIVHAVIHPEATKRTVLADLREMQDYVARYKRERVPSMFLIKCGDKIVSVGGKLYLDEQFPNYVVCGVGGEPHPTKFPKEPVIVAISGPTTKAAVAAHLADLVDVIKRGGLHQA